MPRRSAVLAAKAAIISGLVLAAGTVAVLGSVLAGRLILPDHGFTAARGFPPLSLADGPTLRAAAGSVLYLGLIALLSLGIAALVRDSAVTIGVVLGVLYLLPIIAALIANPLWQHRIQRYTPMAGLKYPGHDRPAQSAHHAMGGPWCPRALGCRRAVVRRPGAAPARRVRAAAQQQRGLWRYA